MKIKPWIKEKREQVGRFRIFDVYKQTAHSPYEKKSGDFYVLDFSNWVNVIALTHDQNVLLIRQYRQGSDSVTLEIPGGAMNPEDTDPLQAAKRELLEETGFSAKRFTKLGEVLPNPAIQGNRCYFYLAEDAEKTHDQNLDPFEEIEVITRPLSEIPAMIQKSEIEHALIVCAFYHLTLFFRGNSNI